MHLRLLIFFDHSIDRDRVSLGFYGGEPLLELDLIKECVKYAKKKSIGKELMFNITSNTTLITDEVLKFLYDNEFSLTVSLDGDRQAHDKIEYLLQMVLVHLV